MEEEEPLELLVLGPRDEVPLFFGLLLPLILKGDRSTTKVASRGATGSLLQIGRRFEGVLLVSDRVGSGFQDFGEEAGTITISLDLKLIVLELDWAAIRYFDLDIEDIGSAKLQCSKMEKGLKQSTVGAGIFSKIS